MFTGPCSAASEDRSAGERSSAICSRHYPGRKMRAVASSWSMLRSCVLALLACAVAAAPALATDANVTFKCCQYTPDNVRVLPGESLTITPDTGVAFDNHPLHYADNV